MGAPAVSGGPSLPITMALGSGASPSPSAGKISVLFSHRAWGVVAWGRAPSCLLPSEGPARQPRQPHQFSSVGDRSTGFRSAVPRMQDSSDFIDFPCLAASHTAPHSASKSMLRYTAPLQAGGPMDAPSLYVCLGTHGRDSRTASASREWAPVRMAWHQLRARTAAGPLYPSHPCGPVCFHLETHVVPEAGSDNPNTAQRSREPPGLGECPCLCGDG